jgi:hypothetical protein
MYLPISKHDEKAEAELRALQSWREAASEPERKVSWCERQPKTAVLAEESAGKTRVEV